MAATSRALLSLFRRDRRSFHPPPSARFPVALLIVTSIRTLPSLTASGQSVLNIENSTGACRAYFAREIRFGRQIRAETELRETSELNY